LSFAGLVVLARSLNPIPSRTRPLKLLSANGTMAQALGE